MTVAVIDQQEAKTYTFNSRDFEVQWYSGTGAGGQHRNKHQNSCRLTHVPTGLVATAQCRSRENSLEEAKATLLSRLNNESARATSYSQSLDRKSQVGSGERGDKVRTYRFQDNVTKDHRSEKSARTDKVLEGNFDLLW